MCVSSLSEHILKLDSVLQVNEGRQICRCLVVLHTWGEVQEEDPEKLPGRTLWQGNDCAQRGRNEQDRLYIRAGAQDRVEFGFCTG